MDKVSEGSTVHNYLIINVQTFYEEEGVEDPAVSRTAELQGSGSGPHDEVGGTGDNARMFPMETLTAIVGGEKPQLCKALIQFVMADSAYVQETPKQGDYPKKFIFLGRTKLLCWRGYCPGKVAKAVSKVDNVC